MFNCLANWDGCVSYDRSNTYWIAICSAYAWACECRLNPNNVPATFAILLKPFYPKLVIRDRGCDAILRLWLLAHCLGERMDVRYNLGCSFMDTIETLWHSDTLTTWQSDTLTLWDSVTLIRFGIYAPVITISSRCVRFQLQARLWTTSQGSLHKRLCKTRVKIKSYSRRFFYFFKKI